MKLRTTFSNAWLHNNPAWIQLLGLCPLLAVSSTLANAIGLALATTLVIVGSNTSIALLGRLVPGYARLPCFVLIIATFTTTAMLIMQAFAFDLYVAIALFVQIIVTNCMILGRAEAFASNSGFRAALVDALGTAFGFALALLCLGAVRELLATGTVFAQMDKLLGPAGAAWELRVLPEGVRLTLAALPPGAFLLAGLLLALARGLRGSVSGAPADRTTQPTPTDPAQGPS